MKRAFWLIIAILASTALVTGCKCKCTSKFHLSSDDMLSKALEGKHFITSAELVEMTSSASDAVILVDLRSRAAFREGHLPGAMNIPSAELLNHDNFEVLKHSEKPLVLYGADASGANGAWFVLTQLEVPEVKILTSGFNAALASAPETARFDFSAVHKEVAEAYQKEMDAAKPKVADTPPAKKKVVPQPKKKVVEEEGC